MSYNTRTEVSLNNIVHRYHENVAKNARSSFLSSFHKNLSGEVGDAIINAYASGNVEAFKTAWAKLTESIVTEITDLSKHK